MLAHELNPIRKRECGSCRLCCKILGVPNFIGKPDPHGWCAHACAGGCAIYSDRPQECRDFNCMWLLDERFGEYWKPSKSKIVINPKLDGDKAYVAFVVDPDYPLRWKQEPWFSDIKVLAKAGLKGRPVNGVLQRWQTLILIGDERIVIGQ
jgi:hypothetical protein